MAQLAGRTAIITGASSGIGRAAAKLFAGEGASVLLAARREQELAGLAAEISGEGGQAAFLAGDVCEEAYARALVEKALQRFGRLDIGFNNAGILGELGPATQLSQAGWDQTLAVNLTGAFLGAKHQIAAMREQGGGSVIFTSSFVGRGAGLPGMAAYAAAKAGLAGLAQVLASEYGAEGIRVNVLIPGGTDTPMARGAADREEALDYFRSLHALGRFADPDEIARAALFLASDQASFVTGMALAADGGASIHRP